MNIEANSAQPKEEGFLTRFSKEQKDFLSTYGIETKEDLDFVLQDQSIKSDFESLKAKIDETPKKVEAKKEKVEASEEKVEVATKAETKSLNAEVGIGIAKRIEETPHTADNTGKLAEEYAALGGVCRNTGIPAEFTTVEISPVINKAFQRISETKSGKVKFDFAKGEMIYEGVRKVDEDFAPRVAFDAAFVNMIPDEMLAKLDREDVGKLAGILDNEASKTNLTPQSIRGFQALAQLAKYNIGELVRVGIFDSDMKLDEKKAKEWVALNAAELGETRGINVANLSWEAKQPEADLKMAA